MELLLTKAQENERSQTFELFKQYMKPIIEDALGWDEAFQENGFMTCLLPKWFYWVEINQERVGLVCYKTLATMTHLHLLIIFEPYQGNGFAQAATEKIRREAYQYNNNLTLSCFKNNVPALHLYKKLGFKIISQDEFFYEFSLNVS